MNETAKPIMDEYSMLTTYAERNASAPIAAAETDPPKSEDAPRATEIKSGATPTRNAAIARRLTPPR